MDTGWNARTRSKKFSWSLEDQRIHVRRSGRIPDARERMVEKSLGVRSSARVEGGIEVEVGGEFAKPQSDKTASRTLPHPAKRKGSYLGKAPSCHNSSSFMISNFCIASPNPYGL
jgi:hypothetical protein